MVFPLLGRMHKYLPKMTLNNPDNLPYKSIVIRILSLYLPQIGRKNKELLYRNYLDTGEIEESLIKKLKSCEIIENQ